MTTRHKTNEQVVDEPEEPKWQPLSREQWRIVGVLVEKAKTTPDAYTLTLNSRKRPAECMLTGGLCFRFSLEKIHEASSVFAGAVASLA